MAALVGFADERWWRRAAAAYDATRLSGAVNAVGPPLLFGLRLWASVCLALYVAFWLELDNAYWAGTSAAIVCQPQLGASLRKGWFRMIGTLVGAVAIVMLTACCAQDRAAFLVALALWGAGCALVATLLRNFASYAAALAGYTAVIVASDQLGATGGPNGDAFMLAVTRASEICIGIVCAGIVLAGTDFGGARRRLATLLAGLSTEIAAGFTGTLAMTGAETQQVRRELIGRVIALDPIIDQAFGESSQLRYYSPVLQRAADGLFAALAGWRAAAFLLTRLPDDRARQEAGTVLARLPEELRLEAGQAEPTACLADPIGRHRNCEAAVRSLDALPADTPSLRLLADQTAEVLVGIAHALSGLALLTTGSARLSVRHRDVRRLRIPDWLPALVNAGRAFVVIGIVELFWIVTAWPNGASAITFAAIGVILLAPRADQAYAAGISYMIGTGLSAALAAVMAFAVLPRLDTFLGFSLSIGLILLPGGAMLAQPWWTVGFTAMTANFIPLLAPANQMSYDTAQFYNSALAIVGGVCAAALSFRLLPPLSPGFRARRLLELTWRDLRHLITRPTQSLFDDWEGHGYGRISALPDAATPLQRAQLLAVVSAGSEIIQLRDIVRQLAHRTGLDAALSAMAQGNIALAIAGLARLDHALEDHALGAIPMQTALRARAGILAISELLAQHATFFEGGAGR